MAFDLQETTVLSDLDFNDPNFYIETEPLITPEMDRVLDSTIRCLARVWGYPNVKAFADSIIEGTILPGHLAIYDNLIGKIISRRTA